METLKRIKKRTASVKGTRKIVGAMKMIAASKLKRIQNEMLGARVYHESVKTLALQIAAKSRFVAHPAFVLRPKTKKILLIVIAAEKGLCGALLDNMIKPISNFISMMKDRSVEVETLVMGSKGVKAFSRCNVAVKSFDLVVPERIDYDALEKYLNELLARFLSNEIDQVIIAYNKFVSTSTHQVTLDMFLPIWVKDAERPHVDSSVDYIYEPSKDEAVDEIINETLKSTLAHAILENRTAETAARMISMDKAHKNASDMVKKLEREYNKVRQSAITRELLDIVGGAEALKSH